jgi:hypothetical protein
MRHNDNAPEGLQPSEASDEAATLPNRVDRYGKAKDRAELMVAYLRTLGPDATGTVPPGSRHDPALARQKLEGCGNWLKFRSYFTVGKVRLTAASFCKEHLICPLCAIRRGGKALQKYQERFSILTAARPDLKPFLVTLTVRNGPDLQERYDHLSEAFATLMARRRKPRTLSALRDASGGVGSVEFTNNGKGWHPHIHLLVLAVECPSQVQLRAEWEQITGDSFMCDVRPIADPVGGFCEVFKYAVKFSELAPADNWHAFRVLSGRRLLTSFGAFRGVDIPESLLDQADDLDSLPYVEILYRYSFAARAYSIAALSGVEAPSGEAASA